MTLDEVESQPANQGPRKRFLDLLDTWMNIPQSGTSSGT